MATYINVLLFEICREPVLAPSFNLVDAAKNVELGRHELQLAYLMYLHFLCVMVPTRHFAMVKVA